MTDELVVGLAVPGMDATLRLQSVVSRPTNSRVRGGGGRGGENIYTFATAGRYSQGARPQRAPARPGVVALWLNRLCENKQTWKTKLTNVGPTRPPGPPA